MKSVKRTTRFWVLTSLAGIVILTYLFATAPRPLDSDLGAKKTLSTQEALTLLAHENDVTRTLFTKAIVGGGKKNGLRFDEKWEETDVIAGPLPALFLRGVADELSRSDVPLGLFLGSDFPIEKSNKLEDEQALQFQAMREDLEPKHFVDPVTGEQVSMFPDFASAGPCVSCHNDHEKSAKHDWKLGDLMGATTWSYPDDSVTTDEFMRMLLAYRSGVETVWASYAEELAQLPETDRPELGPQWPSEGHFIPDHTALRDSIDKIGGLHILAELMTLTASR